MVVLLQWLSLVESTVLQISGGREPDTIELTILGGWFWHR
jgi:hypothetical protein